MKLSNISCIDNRNAGDLTSLVEAIKATGGKLLQPILLKSGSTAGSKLYEVVDGRRRFQALQLMGRTELEASEYRLTEDDLNGEVVAYIANTERKALSPLEEANQICQMLKTMEAEEIAEKLGKTLHYVVSRSRLADLSGKWKQVLAEPDKYPQWTIGKLQMIAREPAATQQEIDHFINNNFTLSDLAERIQYYHRKLAEAPFNWQNFCRVCEYRSDRQGVLFGEDAKEATCLNSECYEKLCFQAAQKQLKDNPKLQPVRSSGAGYESEGRKWADKNKVPESWQVSYKEVTDPAEADGIVCCGDKIGKLVKITSKPTAKTSADTAADKKAEIKEKREILRLAMLQLKDQLKKISRWQHIPPDLHDNVWGAICSIGINGASMFHWDTAMLPIKSEECSWQDEILDKFIHDVIWHIECCRTNPQLDINRKFEKELCKIFTWDWEKDFLEPAEKEHAKTKGKKK